MGALYKTPQARQDIFETFFHVALDSMHVSSLLKKRLEERFQTLADNPEMGRSRPEFGRGVRLFPFDHYLIIYRPIPGGVLILRFLDGLRDIAAIME